MGHSADVRGESLIFQDFNNCFVNFFVIRKNCFLQDAAKTDGSVCSSNPFNRSIKETKSLFLDHGCNLSAKS